MKRRYWRNIGRNIVVRSRRDLAFHPLFDRTVVILRGSVIKAVVKYDSY